MYKVYGNENVCRMCVGRSVLGCFYVERDYRVCVLVVKGV